MKHQEKPIIIVRKRKRGGHGGGHGSWKIAYADFMTAMMAFFLVMWLISIASPSQLAQIADYFRTPLSAAITGGHLISDSNSPIPNTGGDDLTQKDGEIRKQKEQKNTDDLEKLQKEMNKLSDTTRLKKLHTDLDQLIDTNPVLRALRPHLRIDMMKQGLRIQIIDSKKRPMFKLGSAEVEPYMREILRAIAPVLNTIPNKITISGHTDDLPYAKGERSYSNWELSADRANASRRELMSGGLDEGKILRVVGMSSTMNISEQADDPLNRRISMIVLNKEAEQEILQNNAESENVPIKTLQKNNEENDNIDSESAPAVTTTPPVEIISPAATPATTSVPPEQHDTPADHQPTPDNTSEATTPSATGDTAVTTDTATSTVSDHVDTITTETTSPAATAPVAPAESSAQPATR